MPSSTSTITSIEVAFSRLLVLADIARPKLPAELFDHVIDELCDNSAALRATSLVCRRAMIRSRRWLFSTLTFNKDDTGFDAFLDLLERSRWTTFASVKSIRITDLFRARWHLYRIGRDVERMVSHLPNLRSILICMTCRSILSCSIQKTG
ncbi:hypothetical protein F5887DRAFT_957424 [Amanita rubescens]|nr:hypothetical protein F5887DRAFT_957424 [Amanita rubescens]